MTETSRWRTSARSMGTPRYTFRAATMGDLPLLRHWQHLPHIAQWWGSDEPFGAEDLRDDRVSRWIVADGQMPFAYMQDYSVHGWEEHHFGHLPDGSRGMDQYIAEPSMLGRGHGTAIIHARMQSLFADGAPAIGTDPHPANLRAIAVYQRLGFRVAGAPLDTQWGRVLPMVARRGSETG